MKLFVTADLPVYECADPPLEDLWSQTVAEEDLVYVLGSDAADLVLPLIDPLPGRKRLVSGVRALPGGFMLSPLPLHPSQLEPGQINLHGKPVRPLPIDPQRLCVSLELNGFRPVAFDDPRLVARRQVVERVRPAAEELLVPIGRVLADVPL